MISTNQFKNGTHIDIDGKVFKVVEFQHVKPGKGGAFVRSKLRRVEDGAVIDKTFKAGEKFRPVRTETKKMQYLYESGENVVLMDNQSYEQVEIPKSVAEEALRWVPPNSDVDLLLVDEQPSDVQVPSAVELAVTQTDPGLKGDTASGGGTKPATLETGVVVQVPLFIEQGERVRVDTRSGEYVSRVLAGAGLSAPGARPAAGRGPRRSGGSRRRSAPTVPPREPRRPRAAGTSIASGIAASRIAARASRCRLRVWTWR